MAKKTNGQGEIGKKEMQRKNTDAVESGHQTNRFLFSIQRTSSADEKCIFFFTEMQPNKRHGTGCLVDNATKS